MGMRWFLRPLMDEPLCLAAMRRRLTRGERGSDSSIWINEQQQRENRGCLDQLGS